MWRILQFLTKYGNVLLFVGLELIAFLLVVSLNPRQNQIFSGFSMEITGGLHNVGSTVSGYFSLKNENDKLLQENSRLKQELIAFRGELETYKYKEPFRKDYFLLPDSLFPEEGFRFLPCRVINSTISRNYNYITLNKGSKHGVEKGMGLMSPEGVAGRVIAVSQHYSTALSVLNLRFKVSGRLMGNRNTGTLSWDGSNPGFAQLKYIPQTSELHAGDTVVTSGYSTIFPENIMIGLVDSFDKETRDGFYNIRVDLATDFRKLGNLYLVEQVFQDELDSLAVEEVTE